jgi:hypothetical protein
MMSIFDFARLAIPFYLLLASAFTWENISAGRVGAFEIVTLVCVLLYIAAWILWGVFRMREIWRRRKPPG